ncbi:MAG: YkgJ family cysteine cluster protein [Bacteroidota bacterium]
MIDLEAFKQSSKDARSKHKKLFNTLKRKPQKQLDQWFHTHHEEVFQETDCLQCANCCKTTSPIFYDIDIQRLSKALKMKEKQFIDMYLHVDKEGDYVLNHAPCPFLGHDNKCIVYEDRPRACREYPHTNRKRMYQILKLTQKNMEVCPAVLQIVERINVQIEKQ